MRRGTASAGEAMMDAITPDRQLITMIDARQQDLVGYLRTARPRGSRLAVAGIIFSGASAAFTAGPAFGGPGFTQTVTDLVGLQQTSIVWQVLCLMALIVSVATTVTINLANSQQLSSRVAAAETCSAELDGLRTLIDFGQIPVGEAARLYHGYVSKIGFIPTVR
ncbi:hypothetical protein [Microlunatus parietis]|uniref:Uncharacterized protein n=1 Tax=Microlunatus parietis TaxID=682979 RepID=A0A7Y9I8J8_9ACTN|nr:hypothetical protein [Microlunatus parietis]NYE72187.1 hypothetical protein [Microlunatus parietis]